MEIMVNRLEIFERFRNKKVFITGHSGFKGSWLTFILDYFGAKTFGYSLKPIHNDDIINKVKLSENFNYCYNDILDYNSLEKELKNFNPDYIFHLAAQPLVLDSISDPYYTNNVNYVGTLNLLESIRKLKLQSVNLFITTDKVYEVNNKEKSFTEKDPLGGNDPYSASKAASEILIKSYYETYFKKNNIQASSLRAGNIIGGGDWSPYRLIPDIIKYHHKNEKLVIRNLEAVRPWQHILDALFGYLLLANNMSESNNQYCGSWNFGPNIDECKSVRDILNLALKNGLKFNYDLSKNEYKETKTLMLNSRKSIEELNWIKKWNFNESVSKTILWYKDYLEGQPVKKLLVNNLKEYIND